MKSKRIFALLKKAAAFFCVASIMLLCFGCSASARLYEKQDYLMDTLLTQKLYGKEKSEQIAQKASDLIQKREKQFSAFESTSELYKINQSAGTAVSVSKETVAFLTSALKLSKIQGDGFDISVLPLSSLWKKAISDSKLPDADEIEKAASLVDDTKIIIDEENNTVTIPKETGIDLGALLKGAVLSDVAEIYEQNGVSGAICSLGSSAMLLYGRKPDGTAFQIGLRDPFGAAFEHFAVLSLENCVLSTSGSYERFAEINGKTYHHIIDPRTGLPADTDIASVTVVSQDGIFSDYLSTVLFMQGFEKAANTARQNGYEVVIVSRDKKVFVSDSLLNCFQLTAEGYEKVEVK